jgi:hypothetical protein
MLPSSLTIAASPAQVVYSQAQEMDALQQQVAELGEALQANGEELRSKQKGERGAKHHLISHDALCFLLVLDLTGDIQLCC